VTSGLIQTRTEPPPEIPLKFGSKISLYQFDLTRGIPGVTFGATAILELALALAGVNYFFRRIASLDLLPGMGHCLTAIVTDGNGDGRQKWHEYSRGRRGRN
jgi:hypothetical protein